MMFIISVWSIWFFPSYGTSDTDDITFESFKRDILKSFSVFAPESPKTDNKVNIDDLRSRVFGDSIKR